MSPWLLGTLLNGLVSLGFPQSPVPARAFSMRGVQPDLARAQQSYLEKDWARLAIDIKKGLMANWQDPDAVQNLLSLLEAAYAELPPETALSVDWKLPESLMWMDVAVQRFDVRTLGQADQLGRYSLMIRAKTHGPRVRQLRVTRFPNETVIDKAAQVGNGRSGPHHHTLLISYDSGASPPERGLYMFNLETEEGEKAEGWFILSADAPETSIQMSAPAEGDNVFRTAHPHFRWQDHRTPEFRSFEKRWVHMDVFTPGPNDNTLWENNVDAPISEVTVGPASLPPAEYRFFLRYSEEREFGPLHIDRETGVISSFLVTP